jgi:hypothetical protein
MVKTKTRTLFYNDVEIEVEYEYEPFDANEYNSTGLGGGVEILKVYAIKKDITELFFYKIDIAHLEERILDIEENE